MPEHRADYYEDYWSREGDWTPHAAPLYHPIERKLFDRFLRPGTTCLDYGCGDGSRYGKHILSREVDYRGFDISETAVHKGQSKNLPLTRLDSEGHTTLADNSCDVAICFEVLEHMLTPDVALAEIHRILKPNGIALLSVPNSGYWIQRVEFLLTGFLNPGGSPLTARKTPWRDAHIRFFTPSLFRRMTLSAGFTSPQLIPSSFSLTELPFLYRKKKWHPVLKCLSWPFGWLGQIIPSLFSTRLFIITSKPIVQSGNQSGNH